MRHFDYQELKNRWWSMSILNLVARIREFKGRQDLFIRQKPVELGRLVEHAKIQSTEASNMIEGIITTSARMKQLMADKISPKNRDEQEIMGYRDVLNTIHEHYDYIPVKASYILQLHRDLIKHTGMAHGGKFKSVQNYITETRTDGTTVSRFIPLAPHETEEALNMICDSYNQAIAKENIDPLILIPVFISDFLCIHPFNDGNGRMSRLLTLLLLYKSGFTVGKYISIEKEIANTKDHYYDALEAVNLGWHEANNDPVPFISYLLQVILSCYVELEERLAFVVKEGVKSTAYDVVQRFVVGSIGEFTGAEAIASCPNYSRSSILSALGKLVAEGVLIRRGSGPSTRYVRADQLIR